jgi:hypothetical protein
LGKLGNTLNCSLLSLRAMNCDIARLDASGCRWPASRVTASVLGMFLMRSSGLYLAFPMADDENRGADAS